MKRKALMHVVAVLGIMILWSSSSFALDAWKICDLSGDVTLTHGGNRTDAQIGTDIASGDSLALKEGSWIELISTGDCEVWELKGGRQYRFSGGEVASDSGEKISSSHRLAVCFNPAGFSSGRAQRIGGIIERGGSVDEELTETGSNAALINLILIHALNGNDIEKARPYYEELKRRAPGSEFVKNVSWMFETKVPGADK